MIVWNTFKSAIKSVHGTLGPFFYRANTCSDTWLRVYFFQTKSTSSSQSYWQAIGGTGSYPKQSESSIFYRKILVNRGIFDSTFKPKEFFKPLMGPAIMQGSIDKSIDVLALARLYNLVRYRRTCFHRRTGFPLTPTYFSELGIWICFCL